MNEGCLKGVYKKKFNVIKNNCILLLDGIDNKQRDKIISSVLEEFEVAQQYELSVDEITGNNIDKYCEYVCSKLPIKYKFKYIFEIFKYWAYVVLLFNGFELIFNHKTGSLFDIQVNLFGFIISIILCLIVIQVYNIINKNNIIFSIIDIVMLIISSYAVYLYFNILIPCYVVVLISLIVILLYNLLYFKDKFSSDNIDVIISEYLKNSKKELSNINKNNKKNSKITELQYLDEQISITKKNIKSNNIKLIFPIIFSILPSIVNLFYNNVLDSLFFFILLLIIESIIFIPMFSNNLRYYKNLLNRYIYFKDNSIPISKWK